MADWIYVLVVKAYRRGKFDTHNHIAVDATDEASAIAEGRRRAREVNAMPKDERRILEERAFQKE